MAGDVGVAARRQEAERRAAFPDRRCAVGAKCSGVVIVTYGGAQLCTGHALAFSDVDHDATLDRLRTWVRQERANGATT